MDPKKPPTELAPPANRSDHESAADDGSAVQYARLSAVYKLTQALLAARSAEQIYDEALECLFVTTGADRASVLVFDADGVMRFKAWRGLSDVYRAAVEGHSPWTRTTRAPQPVTVADVAHEASLGALRDVIEREGIRSLAFVPLTYGDELLGKFMLYFDRPHEFMRDEISVAATIAGHIAVAVDRRRTEAERALALAEAERANRIKDEFLGTVSHELRTPLNAIFGWNHMLRTGALDAAGTTRAIDAIERNARAQARLVDDLLDVARIDARKLSLETSATEPGSAIESAVESLRPSAEAKRIALTCTIARDIGLVRADSTRIQQVVWNLLSNAVKFTPAGGRVSVDAVREGDAVRIRVEDTGIGIAPDFLPHVFERFRQADSSSTRSHAGLGLGLSIVQHLVALHGGEVFAESEGAGRGARFTVTLPSLGSVAAADAPESAESARESDPLALRGVRVMVVDDEEEARQLLSALISQSGAEVRMHGGVDAALEELARWDADLIVSDIGMPDRDGYSLVRALRADGARREIPMLALSAYARADDRERSEAAGFEAYLTKPVDPLELTRTLAAMMATRAKR